MTDKMSERGSRNESTPEKSRPFDVSGRGRIRAPIRLNLVLADCPDVRLRVKSCKAIEVLHLLKNETAARTKSVPGG